MRHVFSWDATGEPVIWWHSQNLTGDLGREGLILRHGRAWLNLSGYHGKVLSAEWLFGKLHCHLRISTGGGDTDDELLIGLALPGVSLWFGLAGFLPRWSCPREWSIAIHNGSLWWCIGMDPYEWRSDEPKWRRGSFSPVDMLLGHTRYESRLLQEVDAVVPMPEKSYDCTVELSEATWKRCRWPWPLRMLRAHIEVPDGIPHPGKGENAWDIDDDATYSLTCQATTVEEVIGKMVTSVLGDRRRYGGSLAWMPRRPRDDA